MYEKSGSGIPVGLSHENIQRIWITSFLSAFYVFPLLKSPTGGRRMIRKMKLTDLDKVMDIWLFSNIQAHDFIPEEYWRSNCQQVRSMLPEAEVYVYEKDDDIRGFIGMMENYIAGIFVDEKFRSCGIGRELLDYAKSVKKELSLSVYKKNQAAARFYLRNGFEISSEAEDEATGEIEMLMRWKNDE